MVLYKQTQFGGSPAAACRLGPARAGCTNKPNSAGSRRGSSDKQTQFAPAGWAGEAVAGAYIPSFHHSSPMPIVQNKANWVRRGGVHDGRKMRNKPNSRRRRMGGGQRAEERRGRIPLAGANHATSPRCPASGNEPNFGRSPKTPGADCAKRTQFSRPRRAGRGADGCCTNEANFRRCRVAGGLGHAGAVRTKPISGGAGRAGAWGRRDAGKNAKRSQLPAARTATARFSPQLPPLQPRLFPGPAVQTKPIPDRHEVTGPEKLTQITP